MFSNPDHMRHAKEMQLKHWDVIMAAFLRRPAPVWLAMSVSIARITPEIMKL